VAITYTSAIQNRIAMSVWGRQNSGLTADQKAHLDGTWTSGSLTSGMAFDALTRINQYGQWWEQAGASAAPAAWEGWFVSLTALKLAVSHRPDRIQGLRVELNDAIESALQTHSLTDATSTTITGQTLTVPGLRYFVMNHAIRRTPRLFVPPSDIDAHLLWVLNYLWNCAGWNFRKRQVTLTIATNSAVTTDLGVTETLDSLSSRQLYYDDTSGARIRWVSSDEMAQLRARYGTETGRPRFFRTERSGSTLSWKFAPLPDAQYTAKAECHIKGPGTLSDATSLTTELAKFPPEFGPVVRDLVLGRCLMFHSAADGRRIYEDALAQVETFLPAAEDFGRPAHTQTVRDAYQDIQALGGEFIMGGGL
jgi:hypothetical protein